MVRFQLQVDRPWGKRVAPSDHTLVVRPVSNHGWGQSHSEGSPTNDLPWLYYSVKTTQPFADLLLVERVLAGLHPQSKRLVEVVVWTHDQVGSTH